jgi:hypothetical protein
MSRKDLPKPVRIALAATIRALRPHVSDTEDTVGQTRIAIDVVAQASQSLLIDETLSPFETFFATLSHQKTSGLARVGDLVSAAREASTAWRRAWLVAGERSAAA